MLAYRLGMTISAKRSQNKLKRKKAEENTHTLFFWRREFTWFILSCTSGNSSKVPKAHRSRKSPDTRTYFFRIGRLGYKRFLFDPPCLWATELWGLLIDREALFFLPLFFLRTEWVSSIYFLCVLPVIEYVMCLPNLRHSYLRGLDKKRWLNLTPSPPRPSSKKILPNWK